MKSLTILSLLLIPSISHAAEFTKNPMAYAVSEAKEYSKGDMNSSKGFGGCEHADSSTKQEPKILCTGTREILVLGGEAFSEEFQCAFSFRFASQAKGFKVVAGDCE
jgi:hypothetical protein